MPYVQVRKHPITRIAGPFTVALLILAGCGTGESAGEAPETGATMTYERDPLTLAVHASADTISTAEFLELTLSATVEDGYSVVFPLYPEAVEPDTPVEGTEEAGPSAFTLADYEDSPPELGVDGRVTRSRRYRLEPFLEGPYEIPSLEIAFWREVEGEDQKNTVATEPLAITVTSVLTPGEEPGLRDIAGPRSVRDPLPWIRYSLLAVLAAAAAGAFYWYKFRYTPPPPPPLPPVPPHQVALEALEAIRRSKLVEQGRYKEYYIRVSDVLRRYMEGQFQLRAPERTTEEFLEDLQHNAVLGLQEQLLLREFLRGCDLVKFARVEPTSEQIRETMETCEQFIIDSEAASRAARAAAAAPGAEG